MRAKPRNLEQLLWTPHRGPKRGPKPALSLPRVVHAGIRIADGEGLDALSMQRVAAELDAATMALYRHVPGKHELVLLMFDAALDAPPSIDPAQGWRAGLADWARANLGVFTRHRWTLSLVMAPRPMGPNEAAWTEAALSAMAPTGLAPRAGLNLLLVLNAYIRGVAAELAGGPEMPGIDRLAPANQSGPYPLVVQALTGAGAPSEEVEPASSDALTRRFEFGLRRVLDGIECSLNASTGSEAGDTSRES